MATEGSIATVEEIFRLQDVQELKSSERRYLPPVKARRPKALVLGAAQGDFGELVAHRPKCMLPIGGKPVLSWQIEAFNRLGLKEIAVRCARNAQSGRDLFNELKPWFENVAMGKVSGSALEAKQMGLLRESDVVVFNSHEVLHVAKQQAVALAESGYRPPLPERRVAVAGDVGIATFRMMLVNMLEGRFISPYDYEIAERIATVLCGGKVDRGTLVDEEWLLTLERKHFVELAQQAKTQARIAHMLKTGKPLRN